VDNIIDYLPNKKEVVTKLTDIIVDITVDFLGDTLVGDKIRLDHIIGILISTYLSALEGLLLFVTEEFPQDRIVVTNIMKNIFNALHSCSSIYQGKPFSSSEH
jgi:hypothetical protein